MNCRLHIHDGIFGDHEQCAVAQMSSNMLLHAQASNTESNSTSGYQEMLA